MIRFLHPKTSIIWFLTLVVLMSFPEIELGTKPILLRLVTAAATGESTNPGDRNPVKDILLGGTNEDTSNQEDDSIRTVLERLRDVYVTNIQPIQEQLHYADLGRETLGEADVFCKPVVLIMGPPGTGKTALLRHLLLDDPDVVAPKKYGAKVSIYYNTEDDTCRHETLECLLSSKELPFTDILKTQGEALKTSVRMVNSENPILQRFIFADTAGLPHKSSQSESGEFLCELYSKLLQKSDLLILVFESSAIEVGQDLKSILKNLDSKRTKLIVLVNKVNKVSESEFVDIYGKVLWLLEPLVLLSRPPKIFVGSFAYPRFSDQNATFFQQQQLTFLEELDQTGKGSLNRKVRLVLDHSRRLKVHHFILERYHSAYSGEKEKLVEEIIKHPHRFAIYEAFKNEDQDIFVDFADFPKVKDYERFFARNPVENLEIMLEMCKKPHCSVANLNNILSLKSAEAVSLDKIVKILNDDKDDDDDEDSQRPELSKKIEDLKTKLSSKLKESSIVSDSKDEEREKVEEPVKVSQKRKTEDAKVPAPGVEEVKEAEPSKKLYRKSKAVKPESIEQERAKLSASGEKLIKEEGKTKDEKSKKTPADETKMDKSKIKDPKQKIYKKPEPEKADQAPPDVQTPKNKYRKLRKDLPEGFVYSPPGEKVKTGESGKWLTGLIDSFETALFGSKERGPEWKRPYRIKREDLSEDYLKKVAEKKKAEEEEKKKEKEKHVAFRKNEAKKPTSTSDSGKYKYRIKRTDLPKDFKFEARETKKQVSGPDLFTSISTFLNSFASSGKSHVVNKYRINRTDLPPDFWEKKAQEDANTGKRSKGLDSTKKQDKQQSDELRAQKLKNKYRIKRTDVPKTKVESREGKVGKTDQTNPILEVFEWIKKSFATSDSPKSLESKYKTPYCKYRKSCQKSYTGSDSEHKTEHFKEHKEEHSKEHRISETKSKQKASKVKQTDSKQKQTPDIPKTSKKEQVEAKKSPESIKTTGKKYRIVRTDLPEGFNMENSLKDKTKNSPTLPKHDKSHTKSKKSEEKPPKRTDYRYRIIRKDLPEGFGGEDYRIGIVKKPPRSSTSFFDFSFDLAKLSSLFSSGGHFNARERYRKKRDDLPEGFWENYEKNQKEQEKIQEVKKGTKILPSQIFSFFSEFKQPGPSAKEKYRKRRADVPAEFWEKYDKIASKTGKVKSKVESSEQSDIGDKFSNVLKNMLKFVESRVFKKSKKHSADRKHLSKELLETIEKSAEKEYISADLMEKLCSFFPIINDNSGESWFRNLGTYFSNSGKKSGCKLYRKSCNQAALPEEKLTSGNDHERLSHKSFEKAAEKLDDDDDDDDDNADDAIADDNDEDVDAATERNTIAVVNKEEKELAGEQSSERRMGDHSKMQAKSSATSESSSESSSEEIDNKVSAKVNKEQKLDRKSESKLETAEKEDEEGEAKEDASEAGENAAESEESEEEIGEEIKEFDSYEQTDTESSNADAIKRAKTLDAEKSNIKAPEIVISSNDNINVGMNDASDNEFNRKANGYDDGDDDDDDENKDDEKTDKKYEKIQEQPSSPSTKSPKLKYRKDRSAEMPTGVTDDDRKTVEKLSTEESNKVEDTTATKYKYRKDRSAEIKSKADEIPKSKSSSPSGDATSSKAKDSKEKLDKEKQDKLSSDKVGSAKYKYRKDRSSELKATRADTAEEIVSTAVDTDKAKVKSSTKNKYRKDRSAEIKQKTAEQTKYDSKASREDGNTETRETGSNLKSDKKLTAKEKYRKLRTDLPKDWKAGVKTEKTSQDSWLNYALSFLSPGTGTAEKRIYRKKRDDFISHEGSSEIKRSGSGESSHEKKPAYDGEKKMSPGKCRYRKSCQDAASDEPEIAHKKVTPITKKNVETVDKGKKQLHKKDQDTSAQKLTTGHKLTPGYCKYRKSCQNMFPADSKDIQEESPVAKDVQKPTIQEIDLSKVDHMTSFCRYRKSCQPLYEKAVMKEIESKLKKTPDKPQKKKKSTSKEIRVDWSSVDPKSGFCKYRKSCIEFHNKETESKHDGDVDDEDDNDDMRDSDDESSDVKAHHLSDQGVKRDGDQYRTIEKMGAKVDNGDDDDDDDDEDDDDDDDSEDCDIDDIDNNPIFASYSGNRFFKYLSHKSATDPADKFKHQEAQDHQKQYNQTVSSVPVGKPTIHAFKNEPTKTKSAEQVKKTIPETSKPLTAKEKYRKKRVDVDSPDVPSKQSHISKTKVQEYKAGGVIDFISSFFSSIFKTREKSSVNKYRRKRDDLPADFWEKERRKGKEGAEKLKSDQKKGETKTIETSSKAAFPKKDTTECNLYRPSCRESLGLPPLKKDPSKDKKKKKCKRKQKKGTVLSSKTITVETPDTEQWRKNKGVPDRAPSNLGDVK